MIELNEFNEENNFHNDDYEESFAEQENREKNLSNIDSVPLPEKARRFISEKIKEGKEVTATTVVKEKPTYTLRKQFVICFTENFFRALQSGINQSEMKILSYIIDQMEYGNLISISQKSIAESCKITKSNVSGCFKKLIEKNILVKNKDGNVFVNSNIISKGLSTKMAKEKYDNLKKAQLTTKDIEQAF